MKTTKKKSNSNATRQNNRKTTGKPSTKKQTKTPTSKKSIKKSEDIFPKTKEVVLVRSGLDKYGHQNYKAIPIYNKIPKGWKVTDGARAIRGYRWIDNQKSRFSKERKSAFIKDTRQK